MATLGNGRRCQPGVHRVVILPDGFSSAAEEQQPLDEAIIIFLL
jgi:hypothetical protein